MKMKISDRLLLMATALLAAYQVVVGVEQLDTLTMFSYTIAFGVLIVACLLLIILGWEILDSSLVIIVSTIIPLCLSLGLITEFISELTNIYLAFTIIGFSGVVSTRIFTPGRVAVITLAIVHGISGITITFLPIFLIIAGETPPSSLLVSLGGALIGLGGLLLSFLKTGRPILSRGTIINLLPWLLLLMTTCFVFGLSLS